MEWLFGGLLFGFVSCAVRALTVAIQYDRKLKRDRAKPQYASKWLQLEADKGRAYLEALNELNIFLPTDDPDEKALAKYLEETHPTNVNRVRGSYQQLLSPGLSDLFNQRSRTVPDSSLNNINPAYQQYNAQLQNASGLQNFMLGQNQQQLENVIQQQIIQQLFKAQQEKH